MARRPVVELHRDLRVATEEAGHRRCPAAGWPGSSRRHLAPGPAALGQRRLGIEDLDAPDPVVAVGQGEARQLPREARAVERPGARTAGAAGRPPGSRPRAPAPAGRRRPAAAFARGGRGAAARSPRRRRSARGSGSRPGAPAGCPSGAKARSRSRRSRPRSAARPRAARLAPRATASRRSTNRIASSSATAGSIGSPRTSRSGARRGRNGSTSSPRERDPIRPPSSPNLATSADAASSATWPIRRRPNRRSRARNVRVRREQGARAGARGTPPPRPAGTETSAPGLGGEGRHGRREARAGDPRPRLAGERPPSRAPRRCARPATGSGPQRPSSPSIWASSSPNATSVGSEVPAIAGLNPASRSKAASSSARSASGSASRKVASGASRCADPSGIPRRTPSARAAGSASSTFPFDHGFPPRTTGPAGHEPEGRRRLARSRRRCWAMEMEESHGSGSRALGERGRLVDLAGSLRCGLPRLAPRPAEPAAARRRGGRRGGGRRRAHRRRRRGSGGVARRPGGPARLRATITSVRWPTTSRPSRIHDRPSQLEPDAGRLADGRREPMPGSEPRRASREPARGEHEPEGDPGSAGERRQPAESIAESSPAPALRGEPGQVDDQQVHGPTGQQRAGDGQALVGIRRRQDDEPLRPDPARHRLDRIQRRGQVQPGDDRAGGLGLGGEPQRERRPAARDVTSHRHAHPSRHATGPEDGIELGEAGRVGPGPDRPAAVREARAAWPASPGISSGTVASASDELAEPLAGEPGRSRTPARSKGREGRASGPAKEPSCRSVSNICSNESRPPGRRFWQPRAAISVDVHATHARQRLARSATTDPEHEFLTRPSVEFTCSRCPPWRTRLTRIPWRTCAPREHLTTNATDTRGSADGSAGDRLRATRAGASGPRSSATGLRGPRRRERPRC